MSRGILVYVVRVRTRLTPTEEVSPSMEKRELVVVVLWASTERIGDIPNVPVAQGTSEEKIPDHESDTTKKATPL